MTGRLFWFFIGGAAATLWTSRRQSQIDCGKNTYPPQSSAEGTPSNVSTSAGPGNPKTSAPSRWNFSTFQPVAPYGWEEEKAKMQALTREAGDAMTELSDATLDSLLHTVQTLKAKLAEHRTQREHQQRAFAEQLDEQKTRPHDF